MKQRKQLTVIKLTLLMTLSLVVGILMLGTKEVRAAEVEEFQFQVTVEANDTFYVPTSGFCGGKYSKTYNWVIDWGDSITGKYSQTDSQNAFKTSGIPHIYTAAGTYTITITPDGSTDAWFGSFGFSSNTTGANAGANKQKVTAVISPLTTLMTRTAAEISANTPPNYEWKLTFVDCVNLTMGEFFTMPQDITKAGDFYAEEMFWGCNGDNFTMGEAFNLPQKLTSVGRQFASYMFCSCNGDNFTMNQDFTMPQDITRVGEGFASAMFMLCNGASFSMGEAFNLPQKLTTLTSDYFIDFMFERAGGPSFQINDIFCFPKLDQTSLNMEDVYESVFSELDLATKAQNRPAIFILNGNDPPGVKRNTFLSSNALFKDGMQLAENWGGSGLLKDKGAIVWRDNVTFTDAAWGYDSPAAKTVSLGNICKYPITNINVALRNNDQRPNDNANAFVLGTISSDSLDTYKVARIEIEPKHGLAVGEYTCDLVISGDNMDPLILPVSFQVTTDADLSSITTTKIDGTTSLDFAPIFDSDILNYLMVVDYDLSQIKVSGTLSDADDATMTLQKGSGSKDELVSQSPTTLSLECGDNNYTIEVTAADGVTTKSYHLTIKRPEALTTTYDPTGKLADITLPTGYTWNTPLSSVGDATATERAFTATYSDGSNSFSISLGVIVEKATPSYTTPTNLTAVYGKTLADVTLPTGWTFKDAGSTLVGSAGTNTFTVVYTPADTTNYLTAEEDVDIVVTKAVPNYTVPTNLTAVYGKMLADVTLPTGWNFKDAGSTSVGNVGTNTFTVIYTPTDTTNYQTVEKDVNIVVTSAIPNYTVPTNLTAEYGKTLADVSLPTGWTFKDPKALVGKVGTHSFIAVYTDNATGATVEVEITINITAKPVAAKTTDLKATLKTSSYVYNGKARKPGVVVKDGKQTLKKGTDYTIRYKNNIKAGTAKVVVTFKGNYKGTLTKTFLIKPSAQKISAVPASITKTYGSKDYTLKPKLSGSGTITYQSSNRSVAAVGKKNGKITAKGYGKTTITITVTSKNYKKTTKKVTVKITPKKAELTSIVSNQRKQMDVYWKRDPYASGYRVTYSTDTGFANSQSMIIAGNAITSKSIGALTPGIKYYVKVEAYTIIDKKSVYGVASETKDVTIMTGGYIVNCYSLNIRSGPSTSYRVIGYMQYGDSFDLLETCTYNNYPGGYVWYKISYNGKIGYIYCKYGDID